ncbi:leucine-rich repeat domain-containing protein, partial [Planctomycetota bacterium]
MVEKSKIEELVAQWKRLVKQGHKPNLRDLCKNDPDLIKQVKARIRQDLAKTDYPQCSQTKTVSPNDRGNRQPTLRIKGYNIQQEIARGGQGIVFKAVQLSTGRRVALKVLCEGRQLSSKHRARFEREAQVLAALEHPCIVSIIDRGHTPDGAMYFAMDYIDGQPLNQWLDDYRKHHPPPDIPTDPGELLRIFLRIADAVNAAHLRGIIHRDLKPSNIVIDRHGEPHILDFGLARPGLLNTSGDDASLVTVTGQFLGSLPWASPEQAEGLSSRIDTRTDVYSLGVILYQMLTGEFPYEVVGNMRDVLDNIMSAEPNPPSSVIEARLARQANQQKRWRKKHRNPITNDLEAIVLKALNKRPEDRYQNAGDLARDIGHYLSGRPIEATDFRRPPIKTHLRWISAAVILAVIGGLLIGTWIRRPQIPDDGGDSTLEPPQEPPTYISELIDPPGNLNPEGDPNRTFLDIIHSSIREEDDTLVFSVTMAGSFPSLSEMYPNKRFDIMWFIDVDKNIITGKNLSGSDCNIHLWCDQRRWGYLFLPDSEKGFNRSIKDEDFLITVNENTATLAFPKDYIPFPVFDWWMTSSTGTAKDWIPITENRIDRRTTFRMQDTGDIHAPRQDQSTEDGTSLFLVDANLKVAVEEVLGITNPTPADMSRLTELDAQQRDIVFLNGLEFAYNLKTLKLRANQISDLSPLSELVRLKRLELDENQLVEISALSELSQLEYLDFDNNQIVDISPLANLTRLTMLVAHGNLIENISALASLFRLRDLRIESNSIKDIMPLSNLTDLATIRLQNNRISNISALAGKRLLVNCDLSGNLISDISPLMSSINLRSLWLDDNRVSDISLLSNFKNLEGVGLWRNGITDISALSGLKKMTMLVLADNQISDISALSDLKDLKHLELYSNSIHDISPLAGLVKLEHLDLAGNDVEDISVLSSITNLSWMNLGGNKISNIRSLDGLSKLTLLELWGNPIADISPLQNLTHLNHLNLAGCDISDISLLVHKPELEKLRLGNNQIIDISILKDIPDLCELQLQDNQISDISALTELMNLNHLDLSSNPMNTTAYTTVLPQIQTNNPVLEYGTNLFYDMQTSKLQSNISEITDPEGNLNPEGDPNKKFLDIVHSSISEEVDTYTFSVTMAGPFPSLDEMSPGKRFDIIWNLDIDRDQKTGQSLMGDDYHIHLWCGHEGWGADIFTVSEISKSFDININPNSFVIKAESRTATLSFPKNYLPAPIFDWWMTSNTLNSRESTPRTENHIVYRTTFRRQAAIETQAPVQPINTQPPFSKTIKTTAPLSRSALVSNPTTLPGVESWTIETKFSRERTSPVIFDPKDRYLAVGSWDGNIRLYDPHTLSYKRLLHGIGDAVDDFMVSPDGMLIAGWGDDDHTYVWETNTGTLLTSFKNQTSTGFSPSSNVLAFVTNGQITFHNSRSGELIRTFPSADQDINAVHCAFSPDGHSLAVTHRGGSVSLWDLATAQEQRRIQFQTDGAPEVSFSPNGRWLIATAMNLPVSVIDLETGIVRHRFQAGGANSRLRDYAVFPESDQILVLKGTEPAVIYNLTSGKLIRQLETSDAGRLITALSNDGLRAVLGNYSLNRYYILDTITGKPLYDSNSERIHNMIVKSDLSIDARTLVFAAPTNYLVVWRPEKAYSPIPIPTEMFHPNEARPIPAMSLSRDGSRLAMADRKGNILGMDTSTRSQRSLGKATHPVVSMTLSDDGSQVAYVCSGNRLRVTTTEGITTIDYPLPLQIDLDRKFNLISPPTISFSHEARYLAILGRKEKPMAIVFDLDKRDVVNQFNLAADGQAVAMSPQDDSIAWIDAQGIVTVHDIHTSALIASYLHPCLESEAKKVAPWHTAIAWSQKGRYLTTVRGNTAVRWDRENNRLSQTECQESRCIGSFWPPSLSADGRVAINNSQPIIRAWDTYTGQGLLTMFWSNPDLWLAISPEGHYRCSEAMKRQLVWVVQRTNGTCEHLSEQEFVTKYQWKNDPARVVVNPDAVSPADRARMNALSPSTSAKSKSIPQTSETLTSMPSESKKPTSPPATQGGHVAAHVNISELTDPKGNLNPEGDPNKKFLDIVHSSIREEDDTLVFSVTMAGPFPGLNEIGTGKRFDIIWPDKRFDIIWFIDIDQNQTTGQVQSGNDFNIHLYRENNTWGSEFNVVSEKSKSFGTTIRGDRFIINAEGN